jgi:hypothetical protein
MNSIRMIGRNGLDDEGWRALSDALAINDKLEGLDIRGNDFSEEQLKAISLRQKNTACKLTYE